MLLKTWTFSTVEKFTFWKIWIFTFCSMKCRKLLVSFFGQDLRSCASRKRFSLKKHAGLKSYSQKVVSTCWHCTWQYDVLLSRGWVNNGLISRWKMYFELCVWRGWREERNWSDLTTLIYIWLRGTNYGLWGTLNKGQSKLVRYDTN
jgi:hypothetical protein